LTIVQVLASRKVRSQSCDYFFCNEKSMFGKLSILVVVVAALAGYLFLYDPHIHPLVKVLDPILKTRFYACGYNFPGDRFLRSCAPFEDTGLEYDGATDGIIIRKINIPSITGDHNITARYYAPGDSVGGHLTIVASLMARGKRIPLYSPTGGFKSYNWSIQPKLQIPIYPTLQESDTKSRKDPSKMYILSQSSMKFFDHAYMGQILQNKTKHNFEENYCLYPLKAKSFQGVAPALVITASYDPLHDEGEMYVEALRKSGVEVVHKDYPQIHGFFSAGPWKDAVHARELIVSEIKKYGLAAE
jgi:hypothetical protein